MKYLAAAALALFVASPAVAQQAPGTDTNRPAQTMNAPMQTGDANKFMTNEGPRQWLAGNLWNKSVYNAQGKSIGELKDILIGNDGRVQAMVIGVGGFLGLGEKNVAVDYDYLQRNGSIAPNRITLNMTEQDLRSAPSFNRPGTSSSSDR